MSMDKVKVKTQDQIKIMAEGGRKLRKIKGELKKIAVEGKNAKDIEDLANNLIKKERAKSSFKMVKDYKWATCVNVNDGVVHGIPKESVVFRKGDVVSIDVGLFYKGYHTDTSLTVAIEGNKQTKAFLATGKKALNQAIKKAVAGGRIYDLSLAMQNVIEKAGYTPIKALVGHGIGKSLHEAPHIPCFVSGVRHDSIEIPVGAVLAIEAMYVRGRSDVEIESDGWTIKTKDGKIAGLFEETVAVTKNGPIVLT